MATVHVLIAPDSFSGTLTAGQAAAAVASGWREHAPADELDLCPLSDGGPGFVDAVRAATGGDLVAVTVPGPLGGDVPATVLVVQAPADADATSPDAVRTAYVEAAQACGLHLVPSDGRDPTRTTSAGLAPLLAAALDAGCARIVVGVGDLGVLDGGAGLLGALGAGPVAVLGHGGGALVDLPDDALAGLAAVRARFAGVELVAASDVDPPLLGFSGAAAGEAVRLGASGEQAQHLDRALGRFAQVALDTLGPDAAPQRLVAEPGAGAGGGVVFGLTLLGARREPGTQVVMDAVGMAPRLAAADLVVTGEGVVDWRSLRGAVLAGVAHHALGAGVPVVVLAGQLEVGRRELLSVGVQASYAVAERPDQVAAALADPAGTLQARARRVARTWSR